ncbi:MAG: IscS subfamily cysteine desulfurase [Phycisphaerae bacterium]|nr:IscS subfamily cysteine desulfurase [Phycisphaerae bacterium]
MQLRVYLDNNATTPCDPRVFEAMRPYFCERFGNAASNSHSFGRDAEEAVVKAREQVAKAIGAGTAKEIVFTSGATESNNIAIKGTAAGYADKGLHIITQQTEHKAVIDPCWYLEQHGFRVTRLGVGRTGQINPNELDNAIADDTILVSIMTANNEIGTLQPVAEIGRICKSRGTLFHTDATQAVGKIPIDVESMGIDLLSLSGHKIHGPKGVGALYIRRKNPRVHCEGILHGGGHERGMRSGTLNVPGIVGLGKALEIAVAGMEAESARLTRLRDRLWEGLSSRLSDIFLNGHPTERLPNTANISFRYIEGESLIMGFGDVAVSSGSACSSALLEPSYVLRALGLSDELAHSSIRFSLGRFNTPEDIEYAIERVSTRVAKLREMNPLYEMAQES